MKARLFAATLCLFTMSLPVHAEQRGANIPASQKQQDIAKINLNKADASEMAHSIKGIGQKRAEAIVSYRKDHGPFKSMEDLSKVRGLGQQFVKRNLVQLQAKFTVG